MNFYKTELDLVKAENTRLKDEVTQYQKMGENMRSSVLEDVMGKVKTSVEERAAIRDAEHEEEKTHWSKKEKRLKNEI